MHVQSFAVAEAGEGTPGDLQDGRYWLSPLVLDLVVSKASLDHFHGRTVSGKL